MIHWQYVFVGVVAVILTCVGGAVIVLQNQKINTQQIEISELTKKISDLEAHKPEIVTETIQVEKTGPSQGLLACVKKADDEYNEIFGQIFYAKQKYLENPEANPNLTYHNWNADYAEAKQIQKEAEERCYNLWK